MSIFSHTHFWDLVEEDQTQYSFFGLTFWRETTYQKHKCSCGAVKTFKTI